MYSFYLNKQEEIDILNHMLSDGGGCSVAERAEQYHIPLNIAQKCSKEKVPQELIEYVNKVYQEKENDLKKSLVFHTDFCSKNKDKWQMIAQSMEQEVPIFRVRLQSLCGGISNWEGTNIAINAFEYLNGHPAWYATLIWETILALTFHRIRQKYLKDVYSDNTVWAVSEMTSCAIINTDFHILWDIGYRQLAPHQKKVLNMYHSKKSFNTFLEEMLDYFVQQNIRL